MRLSAKQRKYIKKNWRKVNIAQIAARLGLSPDFLMKEIKKEWGEAKAANLLADSTGRPNNELATKFRRFVLFDWLKHHKLQLLALFLLAAVAYANSLMNGFVSDDREIYLNPAISNSDYILHNFPAFLRSAMYYFIHLAFGKVPIFYRLINVFFHFGNVFLIYLIVCLLWESKAAFLAASLTAVHPLLTEAVIWISGGPYVQYTFFLFLAIFLFFLAEQRSKLYPLFLASLALALFSSEKAISYPLILLFLVFSYPPYFCQKKRLFFPLAMGFLWIFYYASLVSQRINILRTSYYQDRGAEMVNLLLKIPTAISSYIELLFWPNNLSFYHTEMVFTHLAFAGKVFVVIVYIGITIYALVKNKKIFFWLAAFIISLLPTLTPFGISWIVAERYAYFGIICLFVALSIFLVWLQDKYRFLKSTSALILILILASLTGRTIIRNIDFRDEDHLWLATAKTAPSSPANHNNLGDYYARHHEYQKSIEEFKIAISLKSNYADAYHNLASILNTTGQYKEAIENYKKAMEFNPGLWQPYAGISLAHARMGNIDEAIPYLNRAIEMNPNEGSLHFTLGTFWKEKNDLTRAKDEFLRAARLNPNDKRPKEELLKLP